MSIAASPVTTVIDLVLREAPAAAREPTDEFIETNLDRLARSIRDARDIADVLAEHGVTLRLGNSPPTRKGRMMFNMHATFAEFEAGLIKMRTHEGMAVAKAKGRSKGKKPKLSSVQTKHLVDLYRQDGHPTAELGELFGVARLTVYRAGEKAAS